MNLSSQLAKALSAVSCLECGKPFRLPDNISEIESLECPHCQQNLLMNDILNVLADELQIPTAAVVKAKEQQAGETRATGEAVEPAGEPAPQIRHEIDEGEYSIPKPLKTAMRRRHLSEREIARRRKLSEKKREFQKKSGGPGEWIRVVFGGVLALPVAQLILWWAFALDPFTLAPTVARFVPLIVPASVLPEEEAHQSADKGNRDMPPNQTMHDDGIPYSIESIKK